MYVNAVVLVVIGAHGTAISQTVSQMHVIIIRKVKILKTRHEILFKHFIKLNI